MPATALVGFMWWRRQTAPRAPLSFLLSQWRGQSRDKRLDSANSANLRGHIHVGDWAVRHGFFEDSALRRFFGESVLSGGKS